MFPLLPLRSLFIVSLLGGNILSPAVAHDVQIADDVGATLHIEPNDIARAGAPTALWFALTQAGGKVIPLADCDCTLTLYDSQNVAVETPSLASISAEGFQDIPGATVTFPDVGAYELVLIGRPQTTTAFSEFELRFEVTVASRTAGNSLPTVADEPTPPPAETVDDQVTAAPDVTTADEADKTDAAIAQTSETPAPASTSTPWVVASVLGGAVVVIGLAIAMLGGRRSPGGKT